MTSRIMQTALLACFVAAVVSAVYAQETRSTIFGLVTDPQNAAVVGATVVVTNADTNTAMTLTTNETGYYEANLLISGNYRITVGEAWLPEVDPLRHRSSHQRESRN